MKMMREEGREKERERDLAGGQLRSHWRRPMAPGGFPFVFSLDVEDSIQFYVFNLHNKRTESSNHFSRDPRRIFGGLGGKLPLLPSCEGETLIDPQPSRMYKFSSLLCFHFVLLDHSSCFQSRLSELFSVRCKTMFILIVSSHSLHRSV